MRAGAEVVGIVMLLLIAISLATVTYAVIQSAFKEPESPDFTPLPTLLEAQMKQVVADPPYVELNLYLSSCKGLGDAYVVLVGVSGSSKTELGSEKIQNCQEGIVTVRLNSIETSYDYYEAFLMKYGLKGNRVRVEESEPSAG